MINSRNSVLTITIAVILHSGLFAFSQPTDSAKIKANDGKIINKIYISNIDVAGPSIEDGNDWQPDIFGEIGNALHIKTKNWVIKNILLFEEGQKLDPQTIDDSERLLRQSGYFYDARITVEKAEREGQVNVHVKTKDKWTLDPQLSYSPKNKNGYLGLKDKNFLGIGHSADITITHDEDKYIGWGGEFDYTMHNIKGSFVDAYLNVASNNKSNLFGLGLSRSFFTTSTEWAGGLNFVWQHDDLRFIDASKSITLIPHSYDSQDLWVGRSFPVLFGSPQFKRNSSFILSGRYYRKHFRIRPPVFPDSNQIFENHRLYLASFGLINREFYKTYFVNEFGVTEDIPLGGMAAFTTGSDSREFSNRWYFGMQLLYSTSIENLGYFSGNFELGGFRYSHNWEQNTIKLGFLYHSPLLYKYKWKGRFFLENNYILGFNRFDGEQIYLDRASGLPGFKELAIPGLKRNVLNLEMRIFTPYTILGFVIGGIAFADYGLIAGADKNLLSSRVYQGYGFGFRTQNQSISKTNFELAVIYNPYNPASGAGRTEITFSATFALGKRDFNFDEPRVIKYSDDQ